MQAPPRRWGAACELASCWGAGPGSIIARQSHVWRAFDMARADSERRSASVVGTAIQAVILLLLLAVLAAVVMLLLVMSSVVRAPNQLGGGIAAQAGRALSDAQ